MASRETRNAFAVRLNKILRCYGQTTLLAIALIVLCCGHVFPLRAQVTSGEITGRILDPDGALISKASVQAISVATNDVRLGISDSEGIFTIPALAPGSYRLHVTAAGFQAMNANVTLSLNQTLRMDFHLKTGTASQTITVSGNSGISLNTENHELSGLFTAQSIQNLPSSSNNLFSTLASGTNVQPYISSPNYWSGSDINSFGTGGNSLDIGGSGYGKTAFLEDGVQNTSLMTLTANMQPSIAATQEVNIIRNGASARFDQPNIVNVITKSGTNSFHGVVYDNLRNDALNAIGEIDIPKSQLRYNQFGANLGGPIIHNKLFFFFDYQGQREKSGDTVLAFVPTAAERTGDFSADNFTIYDPTTYNPATGEIQPFYQNKIPANRINSFSSAFIKYLPLPTGSNVAGNNYQKTTSVTNNYNNYLVRSDYIISQDDKLWGAYETSNPKSVSPSFAEPSIFDLLNDQFAKNAYIQETHVFSPSLVNVARIGFNRSFIGNTATGVGKENYVENLGIRNLNPPSSLWLPPSVSFSSHSSPGGNSIPQDSLQNLFQYADEVDWTVGKQSIYLGAELDRFQFDGNWALTDNGGFSFNGQYTSNHKSTGNYPIGTDIADFLLGYSYLNTAGIGDSASAFRQYNFMPYFEDNYHATNKLTLNLGLRYDYYESPSDKNGHSNVYDIINNTNHNGTYRQTYENFAPRAGFAYALSDNTSLHGGYGIYYTMWMYNNLQFLMANPPNYELESTTLTVNQLVPVQDAFTPTPLVNKGSLFTTQLHMATPYVQEWNLAIQHTFGENWIAEIDYIGSKYTHQEMRRAVNQASTPKDPNNPSPINTRRPYPWVGDVYQIANIGIANYNAFEAELKHRFAGGLSMTTNFVWSKSMDYSSSDKLPVEYGPNPSLDYGRSDYNQPYVYKLSGVYDLPLGMGKRYLNHNVWIAGILGGWKVSGILSINAGFPFDVLASDLSDTGTYHMQRANEVCNGDNPHDRSFKEWFNTACYVQPGVGQLGDESRNNIQGPRNTNLDVSVFKDFPLYKESSLEFRSDFFSALNHPLPQTPNNSVTSPSNGVITSFGGARVVQFSVKIRY